MIRAHEYPIVGLWYWDLDSDEKFEIVARDDKSGSIDLQYFTGNLAEVDLDTWFEMHVVSIAAPSDWSGPFDLEKSDVLEMNNEPSEFNHHHNSGFASEESEE